MEVIAPATPTSGRGPSNRKVKHEVFSVCPLCFKRFFKCDIEEHAEKCLKTKSPSKDSYSPEKKRPKLSSSPKQPTTKTNATSPATSPTSPKNKPQNNNTTTNDTPTKRGRGRPRKYPVSDEKEELSSPKKPKKEKEEVAEEPLIAADALPSAAPKTEKKETKNNEKKEPERRVTRAFARKERHPAATVKEVKEEEQTPTTKKPYTTTPFPVPKTDEEFLKNYTTYAPMNLPEAPVFRPTVEEFSDPIRYVDSIRHIAAPYGICRIIPPTAPGWVVPPPCPSSKSSTKMQSVEEAMGGATHFQFRTKLQHTHQLKSRQGPNELFQLELKNFLKNRGQSLTAAERINSTLIDLYMLFRAVYTRGGMAKVTLKKKWKEIAEEIRVNVDPNNLRQHYCNYLLQYERLYKERQRSKHWREGVTGMGMGGAKKPSKPYPSFVTDTTARKLPKATIAAVRRCARKGGVSKVAGIQYPKKRSLEDTESQDPFGFYDGGEFNLKAFHTIADNFKSRWFHTKRSEMNNVPPAVIESEFWRVVESGEEMVQVYYGSDLDTSVHGTAFSNETDNPQTTSGWNMNILPRISVLGHLDEKIAGVNVPMIYVGMMFSSFCWHTEDNWLYSINYVHMGAPKSWYGVPGDAAEAFESVMKNTFPELFRENPNLLHLLITMLPPAVFVAKGIPVYTTRQEAGEFIITFPRAYHAGFNHGFNCAESVNFALPDWLEFGRKSVENYTAIKRESVFSYQMLLCSAAQKTPPNLAEFVENELVLMIEKEKQQREELQQKGLTVIAPKSSGAPQFDNVETKLCTECKQDCYLSWISCSCCPSRAACLLHDDKICGCGSKRKKLNIRFSTNDLEDLLQNLRDKIAAYKKNPTPGPQVVALKNEVPTVPRSVRSRYRAKSKCAQ